MNEKKLGSFDLYEQFKTLKSYIDKLRFFDKHFSLVPFNFPSFAANLDFILQSDGFTLLINILEKERRNSFGSIKKGFFEKTEVVFDVTPHNSNTTLFNDYIINKFTREDEDFNKLILEIRKVDQEHLKIYINETNKMVGIIEEKIANTKDRTFRKQMFKVFYSGYVDSVEGKIKKFSQKKKFIELYLYSKGILLAEYKETLFKAVCSTDSTASVRSKMLLLNELGITTFLNDKYKSLGHKDVGDKLVELLCIITGERPSLIKDFINKLEDV